MKSIANSALINSSNANRNGKLSLELNWTSFLARRDSAINSALLHLTNRYLMTKHSHTQIHHAHTHTHTQWHAQHIHHCQCQSVKANLHTHTHTQPQSRGAKHNNPGYFQDFQDLQPFCMPRPPALAFMMFHAVRSKRKLQFAHRKLFGPAKGCLRGGTCCKFEANSKQFELTKSCDKNCLSTLVALRMQLQNE